MARPAITCVCHHTLWMGCGCTTQRTPRWPQTSTTTPSTPHPTMWCMWLGTKSGIGAEAHPPHPVPYPTPWWAREPANPGIGAVKHPPHPTPLCGYGPHHQGPNPGIGYRTHPPHPTPLCGHMCAPVRRPSWWAFGYTTCVCGACVVVGSTERSPRLAISHHPTDPHRWLGKGHRVGLVSEPIRPRPPPHLGVGPGVGPRSSGQQPDGLGQVWGPFQNLSWTLEISS